VRLYLTWLDFKTEEYGIYHKQKEIVGEILKNEIVFSCHSERERERKKEFMYLKGTLSLSLKWQKNTISFFKLSPTISFCL
jgi:hypothetical protein